MLKPSNSALSLSDFEIMSDKDVIKYANEHEASEIAEFLLLIKQKRAVRWKDRALLQMIEKSPLTFWASNNAYRVVLWAGKCSDVYSRNLIGKQFPEMMSIYERSDAMKDSISVIEADNETLGKLLADFSNYYTKDLHGNKSDFKLVTNSIQLIDDETGEKFYAEIGLPIDLEKALAEYEERQKELKERVRTFENKVRNLQNSFNEEINILRTKIIKASILSTTQKHELRKIVSDVESEINNNLSRYKAAFDFGDFLRSNEDSIEIAISSINQAIQNAFSQIPQPIVAKEREDREKLSNEIEKMIDIIRITIDEKIRQSQTAKINITLDNDRIKRISDLQEKGDKLIRELTKMKESIESSTSYTIKLFQARFKEIRGEISRLY